VIANVCCFVIVFLVYYAQATAPEIVGILGLDAFHVNKKEQIRVPWRNSNLAPIVNPPPSAIRFLQMRAHYVRITNCSGLLLVALWRKKWWWYERRGVYGLSSSTQATEIMEEMKFPSPAELFVLRTKTMADELNLMGLCFNLPFVISLSY